MNAHPLQLLHVWKCANGQLLPLMPGEKPNENLDCPGIPDTIIALPSIKDLPPRPLDSEEFVALVHRLGGTLHSPVRVNSLHTVA